MRFFRSALAAIIVLVVGGIGVSPAWGACTYSVAPAPAGSNEFTANGGSAAISLTATPGCAWTVSASSPDWCLYNVQPTSGIGSATIYYSMAGNEGPNPVPCSMTIGTATFYATLGGCTYTLDAPGVSAGAGATSGTLGVQTNGWGCQWTPAVSAGAQQWITLTPDLNCCQGSGSVAYSLAANPGAARTGTITVAPPFGNVYTYTVTQPAAPPTVTPTDGLWSIDAEAGASGRGFQIEVRGGILVFTYYGYNAVSLSGLWALSSGPMIGNSFTGVMQTYHGGIPLGGLTNTPAVPGPSLGNLSITFATATTGTITFPGESAKAISKFVFNGATSPSVVPANGLWIVNAESGASGRGFQIEQHGGTLVMTYYGYLSSGNGLWTLSAGTMSGSGFVGSMDTYHNGTVLGGAYAPASQSGSFGTVSINFTSPTAGTITFPGEAAKAISKFVW